MTIPLSASAAEAPPGAGAEFLRGMRDSLPLQVAVLPFGLLFGAVAVQNGMSLFDAVLMSGAIYGGASQMVGLELFGQRIAPGLVIFSILAVNFRHVLYSAAFGRLVPHWTALQKALGFFVLTDPQFAQAERESAKGQPLSFPWYMGFGFLTWGLWTVEAGLGALFGNMLPDTHASGIDFLLPIYFLGLLMDFRKRPLWLPVVAVSGAASMAAYAFVGSPWHVSLGALAGIAVAAAWPERAPA